MELPSQQEERKKNNKHNKRELKSMLKDGKWCENKGTNKGALGAKERRCHCFW